MIRPAAPDHQDAVPGRERPESRRASNFQNALLSWLLPVALLIGVQGFLAFREPIFSPIDEIAHVDYVRHIAEEAELPRYGESRTDMRLLSLYYRQYPTPLTPAQLARTPRPLTISYEALQFPLFYIIAAPVYRLLDGDPPAAVYAVRMFNVGLSALVLVMLIILMRRLFRLDSLHGDLIGLALLLIPGVSLRGSQVTNQVLATLLVSVLLYALISPQTVHPLRRTSLEGGIFAFAVLGKVTAVAAGTAVLVAWLARRGQPARLLASGAGGFLLVSLPWLGWALPVYGQPVPFMARHPDIFFLPEFAPPTTPSGWKNFLADLNHYFWFPKEWQMPSGAWSLLLKAVMYSGEAVFAVALVWAAWQAVRGRIQREVQACRLALTMLGAFSIGYVAFVILLHRVWPTDGRELYVFLGPLGVVLGSLAVRLGERLSAIVFGVLISAWLLVDLGLYLAGACVCSPSVLPATQ
jgi:hypothetical protein